MLESPTAALLLLVATGAAVSGLLAWLLRRSGTAGGAIGSALAAGALAGVLLGPGVLGRVAPELHSAMFHGSRAQDEAIRGLTAEHARRAAALEATGVTGVAVLEQAAADRAELSPLIEQRDAARRDHRAALDLIGAGVAGLLAYIACAVSLARAISLPRARWRALLPGRWGGAGRGVGTGGRAAVSGVLSFCFSAALPALVCGWFLLKGDWLGGAGVGIALGVSAVAGSLRPSLWVAAAAGLACAVLALLLIAWSRSMGPTLFVVGGVLGVMTALGSKLGRLWAVRMVGLRDAVVLPLLACLAVVVVDPHVLAGSGAFWLAVLMAVLWCADGRWMAWVTAERIAGPFSRGSGAWTRGANLLDAGAGAAQLAMAIVLRGTGIIDDAMCAALLIGALYTELTRTLRRFAAAILDRPMIKPEV